MTNKLVHTPKSPFELQRSQDDALAIEQRENSGRLRKALRRDFQNNLAAKEALRNGADLDAKVDEIYAVVGEKFLVATPDEVRSTIRELVQEFTTLEEQGIQSVVTDSRGRAVVPVGPDTVFYPKRIDEEGNESAGFPILHPGISSSLMLQESAEYEIERLREIAPVYAMNMEVERNSEPLRAQIAVDLEKAGWKLGGCDAAPYTEMVGREDQVTITGRDRNPAFSRVPIWSRLFVRSLAERPVGTIELVSVERCEDGSTRWFEITYRAKTE